MFDGETIKRKQLPVIKNIVLGPHRSHELLVTTSANLITCTKKKEL